MREQRKTKAQLIEELTVLRRRVAALEQALAASVAGGATPGSADAPAGSGELYGALIERSSSPIGVSQGGRLVLVNRAWHAFWGYSADEIGADGFDHVEAIVVPESRDAMREHLARPLAGEPIDPLYEFCGRTRDGRTLDVEVSATPVLWHGQPAVQEIYRDVTERRRAEQALLQREAMLRNAQELSQVGSWSWDINTNRVEWSNQMCRIFGLAADEFDGSMDTVLRHIYPDDRAKVQAAMEGVVAGKAPEPLLYRGVRPDGALVWVWAEGEVLRDDHARPARLVGAAQDVTEREQAAQALRASEEKYRTLFENAPIGIGLADTQGNLLAFNDAMLAPGGYTREDIVRIGNVQHLYADLDERAEALALLRRHGVLRDHEVRFRRNDGGTYPTLLSLIPVQYEGQDCLLALVEDLSARREAELAQLRSEAAYRALVEHADFGIYRSLPDDRFAMANPALVKMLGYDSAAELLARRLSRDIYANPDERDRLLEQFRDADRIENLEVEWRRKDGRPILVRLNGRVVRDAQGELEFFEMIAEDVTEQRALAAQLRQAQKMEAVGELTGGLAHDFNNILTIITANAELVLGSLREDSAEVRQELDDIVSAARRGSALVRKLLGFSRRAMLEMRVLDLREVVEELSDMVSRTVPEHVEIEVRSDPDLKPVRADASAVEQIVLNLVTNARDAMPQGGTLRIELAPATVGEASREGRPWLEPGEYVRLSVIDSGIGMDTYTKEHVFDPFFTKKPQGVGTGLGMAMVYGLVKQHLGYVEVESEPAQGTVVHIYFPAATEARRPTTAPAAPPPRGGRETLLVVEDEPAIRRGMRRVLERQGYTVLVAGDGEEALEVFFANESAIDLIVTDLVMPKLGGRDIFEAVRREGREVRFLFISGYSQREVDESSLGRLSAALLRKPWTVDELVARVRVVLDTPR